jgi:hypothetical protein
MVNKKNSSTSVDSEMDKANSSATISAIDESIKENLIRSARVRTAETIIDALLTKNALTRVKVPGHGNCFFEASIKSSGSK